jgi:hypothetical protein
MCGLLLFHPEDGGSISSEEQMIYHPPYGTTLKLIEILTAKIVRALDKTRIRQGY